MKNNKVEPENTAPDKDELTSPKEPICEERTEQLAEEKKPLEEEFEALNDRYLRTVAEYDNYRKRTIKEKGDLLLHASEKVLKEMLPVVDDFELALKHFDGVEDVQALKEGVLLIYQKLMSILQKQGVQPMEVIGKPFDMVQQQAIAMVPATTPESKGQVIDCVKKGYTLHDKVLRFADVVVGE